MTNQILSKEEFYQEVIVGLQKETNVPTEFRMTQVVKTNDTVLDALSVSVTEGATPTIYLNVYYDELRDGRELNDIVKEVWELVKDSAIQPSVLGNVKDFTNFDVVKDKIVAKLVNKDRNQRYLKDAPHVDFLDLAIVFYVDLMPGSMSGGYIINIKEQHLALWGVDVTELYEIAKENMSRNCEYKVNKMQDLIEQLMRREIRESSNDELDNLLIEEMLHEFRSQEDSRELYVLSVTTGVQGSIILTNNRELRRLADRLDQDLILLPSSVHEIIALARNADMSIREVKKMVTEVNTEVVGEDEVLSDNIYTYCRETDKVTIVE